MNKEKFRSALEEFQQDKKVYSELFGGMIKYDANNVAFEFFPDAFSDNKKQENNVSLRPIDEQYIQKRIQDFEDSITEFSKKLRQSQEDSDFSDLQKEFLKASMEKTILQLRYFQKSIWLEAEKSGQITIDENTREKLLAEINALQDQVYGKEISADENEKTMVLQSIFELFERNSDKITQEEKEIFENFFEKFHFA